MKLNSVSNYDTISYLKQYGEVDKKYGHKLYHYCMCLFFHEYIFFIKFIKYWGRTQRNFFRSIISGDV